MSNSDIPAWLQTSPNISPWTNHPCLGLEYPIPGSKIPNYVPFFSSQFYCDNSFPLTMLTIKSFPLNPLSTNCYVVSDSTQEAVIIDCGALYDEEKAAVSDYIDTQELRPVAHILTHAHFDHFWGAAFLHARYGLAARCPEGDLSLFHDAEGQMRDILGHAMRCPTGPDGEVSPRAASSPSAPTSSPFSPRPATLPAASASIARRNMSCSRAIASSS